MTACSMESKRMGAFRMICMFFILAHAMCSTGQPTVEILVVNGSHTDLDNLEEGGNVTLRCEARNMSPDDRVIWQHGTDNLVTTDRITVTTVELIGRGDMSQDKACTLVISPIVGRDRGLYRCRIVKHYPEIGEDAVIVTKEVTLTVFSFPNETSPQCSPSGPVTVYSGDNVPLSCTTFKGYPPVNVTVSASLDMALRELQWNTMGNEDKTIRWLYWTATSGHDGVIFNCSITSSHFPDDLRTCAIGPISIKQRPRPTTPPITQTDSPTTRLVSHIPGAPMGSPTTQPTILETGHCFHWLVAFIVAAAISLISLVVNIALCAKITLMKMTWETAKQMKAESFFIDKEKVKKRNKKNIQLNGLDNPQFNLATLTDVSSSSPLPNPDVNFI